jgi:hypothetical protein
MPMPQKHPLRPLTEQEERELRRIEKASSERVDVVRRARVLLSVAVKQTFPQAAAAAGFAETRSVSQLVERFHRQGMAALLIASGRGRKPTYTRKPRAHILAEVQREPDREKDQTATWSLMLLRDALRKSDLPHIAKETIRLRTYKPGSSLITRLLQPDDGQAFQVDVISARL